MKILLTGRQGQVGWELERALPALGEVIATDRASLDLADLDAVRRIVRESKPDIIVNAAAYTAVDKAESEPELAMRINADAPGVMAEEAARLGALLVHYSTDYVFDGAKAGPYVEDDPTRPINAYGRSKLVGERAIRGSGCRHLILRTSWVYAIRGQNFMNSVLRVARERRVLRVVGDQFGSPTTASALADVTANLILARPRESGVLHVTCEGSTTWFAFAKEILVLADLKDVALARISSSEYPTPASRPKNSVMSTERLRLQYGIRLPHWQKALAQLWRRKDEAP